MTVECDDIPQPPSVTVSDNCDDDIDITFQENQSGSACNQVITRTWTATDNCGNTAVETRTITVGDQTPPVLSQMPEYP